MSYSRPYDKMCLVFDSVCAHTQNVTFKQIRVRDVSDFSGRAVLPTIDEKGNIGKLQPGETWQAIIAEAGRHFFLAARSTLPAEDVLKMPVFEEIDSRELFRHPVILPRSERKRVEQAIASIQNPDYSGPVTP